MATKPKAWLGVVEGLRGGRDSGAIVVFVFGLGCPSRPLPGRQHSPAKRALQATRGALRAVTRCNSHQLTLEATATLEVDIALYCVPYKANVQALRPGQYLTDL